MKMKIRLKIRTIHILLELLDIKNEGIKDWIKKVANIKGGS